jgi:hypothetical protein
VQLADDHEAVGVGNDSGRNHTTLTMPKAAVVSVMPPARRRTVTVERKGDVRASRSARRRSVACMAPPAQGICRASRRCINLPRAHRRRAAPDALVVDHDVRASLRGADGEGATAAPRPTRAVAARLVLSFA